MIVEEKNQSLNTSKSNTQDIPEKLNFDLKTNS